MTDQALNLHCPHCGRINENHDGPTAAAKPTDGDVSICWACRGIGLYQEIPFGGGLTIRKPTTAEQTDLDADPAVRSALAAMTEAYTPDQASALRWGGQA